MCCSLTRRQLTCQGGHRETLADSQLRKSRMPGTAAADSKPTFKLTGGSWHCQRGRPGRAIPASVICWPSATEHCGRTVTTMGAPPGPWHPPGPPPSPLPICRNNPESGPNGDWATAHPRLRVGLPSGGPRPGTTPDPGLFDSPLRLLSAKAALARARHTRMMMMPLASPPA
jgi:hypothetical protein